MSEAVDLTYPEKPDANGTAKKYFRRRAFYFGRHNTPESFILFGEWKKRLVETGEPPEVKTIRLDLQQVNGEQVDAAPTRSRPWPAVVVFSVSVLAISIVVGSMILSTRTIPMVDGKVLTEQEARFVRGLRLHGLRAKAFDATEPARIAELYARIKELGPNDGPLHEPAKDF